MADDLQDLGTTLEFRDLLLEYQNWKERPRLTVKSNVRLFGFEGTVQQVINHSEVQPHALQFIVTLENQEQIYKFLTFFEDRKGRLERFWFPLPYNVFEIVGQQVQNSTELKINSPDFEYRGFERVYLLLDDESLITRHVTSVAEVTDNLLFSVSELDRTIDEEDIILSSLLLLCRFDMDEVELNYKTNSCAEAQVRLIELVNEYDQV